MAWEILKPEQLPVSRKAAGEPAAVLRENGQLSLNKKATEVFNEIKTAVIGIDRAKSAVTINAMEKPPKGFGVEVLRKIGYGKKTGTALVSLTGYCKVLGYDYKAKGNQAFSVDVNSDKRSVTFALPMNAAPAVPKPRKPKAAAKSAPAPAAAAVDAPVSDSEFGIE